MVVSKNIMNIIFDKKLYKYPFFTINKMVLKKVEVIGIFIILNLCFLSILSATVCTDIPAITNKSIIPGDSIRGRVILSLTGFNLPDGTVLPATIYERDSTSSNTIRVLSATVDANGNANVIWVVTQADLDKTPNDYEQFYFTTGGFTSGYLKLIDLTRVYWEDAEGTPLGEGTSKPNFTVSTSTTTNIFMLSRDPRIPEGTNVTFEIWEDDAWPYSDNYIKTVYATFTGGKATGVWSVDTAFVDTKTGDYDDFYFKAITSSLEKTSNDLKLIKHISDPDCEEEEVSVCEQYDTEEECEFDDCSVTSFGDICIEEITRVISTNPYCYYYRNCFCGWNSTTNECRPFSEEKLNDACQGTIEQPITLGFCNIVQSGDMGTCEDDGFLSYSWTATWDWKSNVYNSAEEVPGTPEERTPVYDVGKWHYPSILKTSCVSGGPKMIACPTSVALSGFGILQLVVALIIIALIYSAVFLFRKKAKKKNNKKIRRK
jgi:hypothetical protein